MPSENKTPNYGLNQWQGNEYPKRQDFVDDNATIDAQMKDNEDAAAAKIPKSLATASDQVLVSSGVGTWIVKTLAQLKSWLGLGSAAYKNESDFETPSGAQEKADAALSAANGYTDGAVDDLAGAGNATTVKAVNDALTAHKSDTAASAHKDKNIAVVDANNHFTGTTLNAVLDELFTFANDGKTNLAAVIGSPAAATNTFTQLKDYIQTDKNTLATNLTNKGQISAGTETLAALVAKVANVNTGKKYASGTVTSDASGNISITGLSFMPEYAILWFNDTSGVIQFNNDYDHLILSRYGDISFRAIFLYGIEHYYGSTDSQFRKIENNVMGTNSINITGVNYINKPFIWKTWGV